MHTVIGEILPLALVVTVSPINIIAAILLLFSPRPIPNASAYLAGFVLGVGGALALVVVVADAIGLTPGSDRSTVASVVLVVVGAALVAGGVLELRKRPGPDEEVALPGWMAGIDAFSTFRSFRVGVLIGAANPKNLAVAVASAVTVANAGLPAAQQVVACAVYVLLAVVGVATPLVVAVALGDRSQSVLESWRTWLVRNNAAVMAVIFLVFGVVLIGKGIAGA